MRNDRWARRKRRTERQRGKSRTLRHQLRQEKMWIRYMYVHYYRLMKFFHPVINKWFYFARTPTCVWSTAYSALLCLKFIFIIDLYPRWPKWHSVSPDGQSGTLWAQMAKVALCEPRWPKWHSVSPDGQSGTLWAQMAKVPLCEPRWPKWHSVSPDGQSATLWAQMAKVPLCEPRWPKCHSVSPDGQSGTLWAQMAKVALCEPRWPKWHSVSPDGQSGTLWAQMAKVALCEPRWPKCHSVSPDGQSGCEPRWPKCHSVSPDGQSATLWAQMAKVPLCEPRWPKYHSLNPNRRNNQSTILWVKVCYDRLYFSFFLSPFRHFTISCGKSENRRPEKIRSRMERPRAKTKNLAGVLKSSVSFCETCVVVVCLYRVFSIKMEDNLMCIYTIGNEG